MLIRDNLLVTAGARAAYMDMRGDIKLPSGLDGEDELAEFVVDAIETYGRGSNDIPFDEFIETELIQRFGKKSQELIPWRIWFELYEGDKKIGAGVWHTCYKYKGNAVRRAKAQFGEPRVNRNTGKTYIYKWFVSQTNPWHK